MPPSDGSGRGVRARTDRARLHCASWTARGILLTAAALLLLGAVLPAPARGARTKPSAGPTLSRTTVPAQGPAESLLTVGAFGRYAVTVKSPTGTSLRLVDRMTGPGEMDGAPGEADEAPASSERFWKGTSCPVGNTKRRLKNCG